MIGGLFRLAALLGNKSVQVWEWDEAHIMLPRLPNGPMWSDYAKEWQRLTFSGWQLAHAIAKADFLNLKNPLLPGLAFLLQSADLIDTKSENLRVVDNIAGVLNDFALTSYNGRIAQGISLLFANKYGYIFAGHLASDPAVPNNASAADFIFETGAGTRMILESKGSFSVETNDPTKVKSILKLALERQVKPWLGMISPPATKGFATLTCIRGISQLEDSALIFVDPPGQGGDDPTPLEKSWVRRRNYAAWLDVMGLRDSATLLLNVTDRTPRLAQLPVFRVGEFEVAAVPSWDPLGAFDFIGSGIEVSTLRRLQATLFGDERELLEFQGIARLPSSESSFFDGVPVLDFGSQPDGSMMPDGTYFGTLRSSDFLGFDDFKL
ncbi:hypothetical protein [Rhizobium leguminosarum]|uniref:hypothetical protein n=1 Tax=Rhizobium leguminosarum TaxID=384 RepID=UPI003F9A669E